MNWRLSRGQDGQDRQVGQDGGVTQGGVIVNASSCDNECYSFQVLKAEGTLNEPTEVPTSKKGLGSVSFVFAVISIPL